MMVATMITYASGGYNSPFAALFFLVITVSALRFGAVGSVLCAVVVALLYLTAGAVAPLQQGTYIATFAFDRIVILQRMFLFVVVAVLGFRAAGQVGRCHCRAHGPLPRRGRRGTAGRDPA